MSKINLLPWREEQRKISNRIFYAFAGITIFAGILTIGVIHLYISYRTDVENANVEYLNKELKSINSQITQIQGLQEAKENLLNRMRIIQELQEDRSSIVKLLDMLPRMVPDSVYLTSLSRSEPHQNTVAPTTAQNAAATTDNQPSTMEKLKQEIGVGEKEKPKVIIKKEYHVEILGVAQTNSGISTFMKHLQEIDWVSNIKYTEVSINKTGEGLNFKLEFTQSIGTVQKSKSKDVGA